MKTLSLCSLLLIGLGACGDAATRPGLGATCTSDEGCASGLCLQSQCVDPDADDDGDGLTNRIEAALGTDHKDADSDADGQDDGAEVDTNFANKDSDGDGKPDALESASADADGDCIPDQEDPDDATPFAEICPSVGVCKGQEPVVLACGTAGSTGDGWDARFPRCDLSGIADHALRDDCDGLDNDCDGATDEDQAPCGQVAAGCACGEGASCECNNGRDYSPDLFDQTVCVASATCNAVTACPEGYTCMDGIDGKACVCTDPSVCGVVCDSHGDCPCGLVCDPDGRCVDPIPCAFSAFCDAGERCYQGDCVAGIVAGSKANGAECGEASECAGGACVYRTCTTACVRNDDCGEGSVCAESDNLQNNGCAIPTEQICPGGCAAPEATCALYTTPAGACATWCAQNADCDGGRCAADFEFFAHPAAPFLVYRVCAEGPATCGADELEVDISTDFDMNGPVYCTLGAGCRGDADCPESHALCALGDHHGPDEARGLCVRSP